jgi:hypothetical protein
VKYEVLLGHEERPDGPSGRVPEGGRSGSGKEAHGGAEKQPTVSG